MSQKLGYVSALNFSQKDKAYMIVSLTHTQQRKNSGEYNGGRETRSNLKKVSLNDILDKFLRVATGKVKSAVDMKVTIKEGFGVLRTPFLHSGAGRVEGPQL